MTPRADDRTCFEATERIFALVAGLACVLAAGRETFLVTG